MLYASLFRMLNWMCFSPSTSTTPKASVTPNEILSILVDGWQSLLHAYLVHILLIVGDSELIHHRAFVSRKVLGHICGEKAHVIEQLLVLVGECYCGVSFVILAIVKRFKTMVQFSCVLDASCSAGSG